MKRYIWFGGTLIVAVFLAVIISAWFFADETPLGRSQIRAIQDDCSALLSLAIDKKHRPKSKNPFRSTCRCVARRYARTVDLRQYYLDKIEVFWKDILEFYSDAPSKALLLYTRHLKRCERSNRSKSRAIWKEYWRDFWERYEENRSTDVNPYNSDESSGPDDRGQDTDLK